MAWRLAKSLTKLREQINAAHPARSKVSDGSIGDQAHSTRTSDHNPDNQGRVCAVDITHDLANGADGRELSRRLTADPRMKYVIFGGVIFKARTGQWEPYRGSNPHNKHVHISVKADSADDETPWDLAASSTPKARHTLKRGHKGPAVGELQKALGVPVDDNFGAQTENAVREFQAHHGLTVDGIAGKNTLDLLFK